MTQGIELKYVLYSCYATAPLENNPFLTFFLQLLEELPAKSVEQHFVYCILEETLSRVSCALVMKAKMVVTYS